MNKQLTKEECLEAVEYLKRVFYQDSAYAPIVYYYEDGSDYKKMVDVLQQLINEHFELKEIIKNHGLENLTLHELDCAFRKMLSYVEENNRLMNFLSQQNEIIKEYQNGEAYKELKRSFDELLGHAVAFQEELINLKDNPPLKFEELHENMWVWDNYYKIYVRVTETLTLKTLNSNDETFIVRVAILTPSLDVTLMSVVYDKYRFYKYEVENDAK